MAEYERSSRATPVTAMHPPLAAELARVAAAQGVGSLEAARLSVQTRSRRIGGAGLFARLTGTADPDVEHWTAVVLTRAAVLVGVSGEKRGTRVFFVPLSTLELEDAALRPEDAGRVIGLKSPSIGGMDGRVASYAVHFGDAETAARTLGALRDALGAVRAG